MKVSDLIKCLDVVLCSSAVCYCIGMAYIFWREGECDRRYYKNELERKRKFTRELVEKIITTDNEFLLYPEINTERTKIPGPGHILDPNKLTHTFLSCYNIKDKENVYLVWLLEKHTYAVYEGTTFKGWLSEGFVIYRKELFE